MENIKSKPKKSKLSLNDLVDSEGLGYLTCVVNELSKEDLVKIAQMAFDQKEFLTKESQLINENKEIQVALFGVILEKFLENLKKEDHSTEFIKQLLKLRFEGTQLVILMHFDSCLS